MSYVLDFWCQWTGVAAFSGALFSFAWIRPRFGTLPSLLFLACVFSSLWVWLYVDNRYVTVNVYDQMALRYFACDSIAKILLITVPMMALSDKRRTVLMFGELLSPLFVIASSSFAVYEALTVGCSGLTCGGLIGNPSISMGCMACMLPIFLRSWRTQWPILLLASVAILLSQSSIAIGLLAAYACMWLFPWRGFGFKRIILPAVVSGGVLAISPFAMGSKALFHTSGRFFIWQYMMKMWAVPGNILIGTGLGTYHVFSINLQNASGHNVTMGGWTKAGLWWNTLHNDWLQMLFECGAVGCLLLLATYGAALFKLYLEKIWRPLVAAVMYGIYMTCDPALHNPIPILFGAWLFVYALRREPNKEYV